VVSGGCLLLKDEAGFLSDLCVSLRPPRPLRLWPLR